MSEAAILTALEKYADKSNMKSSLGWEGRILSTAFGLALCGLILEIGLRIIPTPGVSFFHFRSNPRLGLVLAKTDHAVHAENCFLTKNIHYNSLGFRDKEHSIKKKNIRIAVMGDSFLEGFTVNNNQVFHAKLTELTGIETLNFSRRGYGTANSLAVYELLARRFKPDLVLLGFYMGNDVHDDYAGFHKSDTGLWAQTARVAIQDGKWTVTPPKGPPVQAPNTRLSPGRYSYLYRFIQSVRRGGSGAFKCDALHGGGQSSFDQYNVYRPPRGEWLSAWKYEKILLKRFQSTVKKDHGEFAVMTIPGYPNQMPDAKAFQTELSKALKTLVPKDLNPQIQEKKFLRFLKGSKIPAINLYPAFRNSQAAIGSGRLKYTLPCDSHWNAAGHELAARKTAGWITTWLRR